MVEARSHHADEFGVRKGLPAVVWLALPSTSTES